ncbi:leucine-rich repeat-containing protein 46 [Phascolarctos cinereus]|uniref:Leucine-rich repeat-containing protein 46 n=1 Tax=Phascolarctos cinereus TaxID=38626 RepID=A0A6P5L913_PHACI|nr:leucine-rich repeat-containing protein 46 [Phascolarctos cinereus]XP_020853264.1 leucine-rich repeat-containing protein 46 [Phascolarctos cinereus]
MRGVVPAQSPVGVCISDALIAKRNLAFKKDKDTSKVKPQALAVLQTVRLDREGIGYIGNLEGLRALHSLYLQENEIRRIENLDCLPCLRFLTLAGNKIQQIENLRGLQQLQLLDLSHNQIATLQLAELPQNLLVLNLSGNDCTKQDGYREMVTESLHWLLDLDGEKVPGWEDPEENKVTDTQDEFPELSGPFCSERGFFEELEQELASHRERRLREVLLEHEIRMAFKPVTTDLSLLPGAPPPKSHSPSPVSGQDAAGASPTEPPSATRKPRGLDSQPQSNTVKVEKRGRLTTGPQAKAQHATTTAAIRATK